MLGRSCVMDISSLGLKLPNGPSVMVCSVILAFGRLRQEDCKFEVSLDYMLRFCLKTKKKTKKKKQNKKDEKKKILQMNDEMDSLS
jgi:hypothetical protein